MTDALQVADYFSRVLRRGRLESVQFQEDKAYVVTSRADLSSGTLPTEACAELFAFHDKNYQADGRPEPHSAKSEPKPASESAQKTDSDQKPIPVVISLVSLKSDSGAIDGLLLLAASLYRDGRLEPELETGSSPWIPSDRLESPSISGRDVMVGCLDDFWRFTQTDLGALISQSKTLEDAFELSAKLFEAVTGQAAEEVLDGQDRGGHQLEYELCYIQEFDRINAISGLLGIYDFMRRERTVPALVSRIANGWPGARLHQDTFREGERLFEAAKASCGSMNSVHSLTDSQRSAVYAFISQDDGDITSVSGPPGTGKTTMLQAVVANLLSQRAIDQAAAPIIVGTSTNNQAVTNIIASFDSVAKADPGTVDYRWLVREDQGRASANEPLGSLAVYCPSKVKLKEAKKKFLVEQRDKSQTYTAYSGSAYLADAKDLFVMNAQRHFGRVSNIAQLQQWIHDELVDLDRFRRKLLETMHEQGPSEAFADLCHEVSSDYQDSIEGLDALADCLTLEQLDQKLDVTLRYAQFWLAVHYFEAQWLLTDDFLRSDDRWKSLPEIINRYWWHAAALTPCFVMTLFQVPKYFQLYSKPGEPADFDVERIDLLIVDEAGQVDTPISLPVFALAKRALVVGDEKQLSPVWSTDELTDSEVATSVGIAASNWRNDLLPRGLTSSSPSSLMRAATRSSRNSHGHETQGLFLAEHFRCHPNIIGFCNSLIYDGQLRTLRPASSSKLDAVSPAFLRVGVRGSIDAKDGSSRSNKREAEVIAEWIVKNYSRLLAIYHEGESEPANWLPEDALLAVVTPFAAQARLIRRELRKTLQGHDDTADLPARLWERITIGTAHRLQGAERPIILFSAVYGLNSPQATFIDANPELMNVAVSRAKDLFIVFAADNRWNEGKVFNLMSQFAEKPGGDFWAELASTEPIPLTLTSILAQWRKAGMIREEDSELSAKKLNSRLLEVGVLEGAPGSWTPSKLALTLGVAVVHRSNAAGESYDSIEYSPPAQELLLDLYTTGKI